MSASCTVAVGVNAIALRATTRHGRITLALDPVVDDLFDLLVGV